MDFFQAFLNLVVPPITLCVLLILWPVLSFYSVVVRFFRALLQENMRGKIVLITGATSNIGQALAYQYARRGAVLSLVSPQEDRLNIVADRCRKKGAMAVRAVRADSRNEEDCKRFIQETLNDYGRFDYLVLNSAVPQGFLFEDAANAAILTQMMDVAFWGYVYPTFYALPHLKRFKGKIVVNASVLSWMPFPRLSIDGAAKAAVFHFFETLRIELGSSIGGITIVTPGWIESDLTMGKLLNREGQWEMNENQRDLQVGPLPVAYADECATAIIQGAARRHRYVRFPYWYTVFLLYRVFAPEVLNFLLSLVYMTPAPGRKDGATVSKAIMEVPGMKLLMYPASVRNVKRQGK